MQCSHKPQETRETKKKKGYVILVRGIEGESPCPSCFSEDPQKIKEASSEARALAGNWARKLLKDKGGKV